jgi:hypothetical protein
MQGRQLTPADIALIAGTRIALGIGIGLLISGRLNRDQRKAAGVAMIAVGAATTVPLAVNAIASAKEHRAGWREAA